MPTDPQTEMIRAATLRANIANDNAVRDVSLSAMADTRAKIRPAERADINEPFIQYDRGKLKFPCQ
jgi:hypothetical protein